MTPNNLPALIEFVSILMIALVALYLLVIGILQKKGIL